MLALWKAGVPRETCLLVTLSTAVGVSLAVAEYGEPVIRKALAGILAMVERPTRRLMRIAPA
jgi:hypothetical protein